MEVKHSCETHSIGSEHARWELPAYTETVRVRFFYKIQQVYCRYYKNICIFNCKNYKQLKEKLMQDTERAIFENKTKMFSLSVFSIL